jgi:hypothetical protein
VTVGHPGALVLEYVINRKVSKLKTMYDAAAFIVPGRNYVDVPNINKYCRTWPLKQARCTVAQRRSAGKEWRRARERIELQFVVGGSVAWMCGRTDMSELETVTTCISTAHFSSIAVPKIVREVH